MCNQTKHKERKNFCLYCLQRFSSKDILINHKENCISIDGVRVLIMPKADDIVHFKNYHKKLPVPFVIYANFEAITKRCMVVKQIGVVHTPKLIKLTKTVVMDIKLSVVTMMNTQNQRGCIVYDQNF